MNFTHSRGNFFIDISAEIKGSGITAIFGPTGSGKSTLLDILAGVEEATRGQLRFRDRVFFCSSSGIFLEPEERDVGYVFQEGLLFPNMTVMENLEFAIGCGFSRRQSRPHQDRAGQSSQEFHAMASREKNYLIDLLDMGSILDSLPSALSGGQRQRASLARTLLSFPDFLLADEPFNSVDLKGRGALMQCIRDWPERSKGKILLVTHQPGELMALADDVLVLKAGRVIYSGPPGMELFQASGMRPVKRDSIDILLQARFREERGAMAYFDCHGQLLRCAPGQSVAASDGIRILGLSSSSLTAFSPDSAQGLESQMNRLRVRVADFTENQEVRVEIELLDRNDGSKAQDFLVPFSVFAGESLPEKGSRIDFFFPLSALSPLEAFEDCEPLQSTAGSCETSTGEPV